MLEGFDRFQIFEQLDFARQFGNVHKIFRCSSILLSTC